MSDLPELLTVKEVSAAIRIPERTIRALVQAGTMPSVMIGGRIRFDLKAVTAWIDSRRVEAKK